MKKNMAMRVAALVLMCTIVTSCFVGSTFAKYTSSATGSDTVTVARWDVSAGGVDITQNDSVTFDLFGTVNDSDYTTPEQDVLVKDGVTLVAPGTGGKFDMNVENTSEVNATYSLDMTEVNASNVPIQYSFDDGNTWQDDLADVEIVDKPLAMLNGTDTITVYWRWVYDGTADGAHAGQTDITDTSLGTAATAPTVSINASITITQVD